MVALFLLRQPGCRSRQHANPRHLARSGQEVMAIDLVIFTDIGKAGKRLFFIRGANLLKLFFKP
jgi:hypothetical protein